MSRGTRRNGKILIRSEGLSEPVYREQSERELLRESIRERERRELLRSEREVRYKNIIEVIGAVRNIEAPTLSIRTTPETTETTETTINPDLSEVVGFNIDGIELGVTDTGCQICDNKKAIFFKDDDITVTFCLKCMKDFITFVSPTKKREIAKLPTKHLNLPTFDDLANLNV